VVQEPARTGLSHTVRVGWELLQLARSEVQSLEEQATRIVAAQIAALIALWSQLHTFDEPAPKVLAWAAWAGLVISIARLGPLVTPRRIARFWDSLPLEVPIEGGIDIDERTERALVAELAGVTEQQSARLRSGLRVSIAFGIIALGLVALGYVLEKF
jgi:hypothetical protein